MKSFLLACLAIVAIAVLANVGLGSAGFSSQDQSTSASVRVE